MKAVRMIKSLYVGVCVGGGEYVCVGVCVCARIDVHRRVYHRSQTSAGGSG